MGMAIQERWRSRELDRQIKAALFERAVLHPVKLSTVLREVYPQAAECFKDSYRHCQTQEKKGRREIMSHRFATPQPKILAPKHLRLCQEDAEGLRVGCDSRESVNPRR